MQAFPVRLFHACLSGVIAGTILALFFFHIQGRFLERPELPPKLTETDVEPTPIPAPSQVPVATNPPSNPDDRDGDTIPNDWEIQFHHDPDKSADAGSDFDNDGLTALQEYQLYSSTSGASGNPLGIWATETLQRPSDQAIQYLYARDINSKGEILINADMSTATEYHLESFLVGEDQNWALIQYPDPSTTYIMSLDLNDAGTVIGSRLSSQDWGEVESFFWSSTNGYQAASLNGKKAFPFKINNSGDWVGYVQSQNGAWLPANVINGINMHSNRDWWSEVWYQDINDFGESLGTYGYGYGQNAFLAYGSWLYDTGLEGSAPELDEGGYSFLGNAALNHWGEFTAGVGGTRQGYWVDPGYVFDGEFREIQNQRLNPSQLYPYSISDDQTVAGIAGNGGFVHRDGVTVRVEELASISFVSTRAVISGNRLIAATSADGQSIIIITPDQDQDGDGMPDDWEQWAIMRARELHPSITIYDVDPNGDLDGDGTNNLGEYLLRSDPNAAPVTDPYGQTIDLRPGIDTDGDGIPNTWEWQNGLNIDDPTDAPLDYDRDGYSNLQEFHLNTDPRGAPSYRMRVIGPFPGASSASLLYTAVLGDGFGTGNATYLGGNITETVHFPATPESASIYGSRPATWSVPRSDNAGTFSLSTSLGNVVACPLIQSPSGASLMRENGNPSLFYYLSSPTAQPITLSGAENENDVYDLGWQIRISQSGSYIVGIRQNCAGTYQPVVWKMPTSPTATYKPIRLISPDGCTLPDWTKFHVNDHGYVMANGTVTATGQNRPILWQVSADGLTADASVLPPLPGSNWASATGISNQNPPLICGDSSVPSQTRAVVWTAAGAITNLGTLPNANSSSASLISRGGSIAGIARVLVGTSLQQQPFLATFDALSSTWKLQPQGEPSTNAPKLTSINDFGEIIGTINEFTPTLREIPTLWSHGHGHAIEPVIAQVSGTILEKVTQLSPHGTLLATIWKDGNQLTVLLTPDRDTDNDGLPDAFENQHSFNAFVKNNPATDSDSDGLSDLEELRNNTDPRNPDTDDDGMKDGFEVSWGLLPLDSTDAPLDPDNDRVTNLRESQNGTTPTGIYKVETRYSAMGPGPNVLSSDDAGQVIYSMPYQFDEGTDENGIYSFEAVQDYFALPALSATPVQLPGSRYYNTHNSDWTESSYTDDSPSYRADSLTGLVIGDMKHSPGDPSNYNARDDFYLIPDAINQPNGTEWTSWNDVENNLRDPSLHDGNAPLESNDHLNTVPDAVSQSGTRRLHHSNGTGECFILNERGEFISKLADTNTWSLINDEGVAARVNTLYNPVENQYSLEIAISTGKIIQIPNEPGIYPWCSLISISNDGKVLFARSVRNEQNATSTQFFLHDIATAATTRVRSPGFGYENFVNLSNQNGRLLGNGPKPFQITPDGTCIRLAALRIKNSPTASPVPFGTLYPQTLTPNHIASNGRITLTTTNAQSQQVILQITPHNDADGDGVPDDWETSTGITSGSGDQDGDGLNDADEFANNGDPFKKDTDGDGMTDGLENQAGFQISDADENRNGLNDGWEDFDDDSYINREETICETNARADSSRPDGTSASMAGPAGSQTPVLCARNFHIEYLNSKIAKLSKPGFREFTQGEVTPHKQSEGDDNQVEQKIVQRPKFYLEMTTIQSHEQSGQWRLTYYDDPPEYVVGEDWTSTGTVTTLKKFQKNNGQYISLETASGNISSSGVNYQIDESYSHSWVIPDDPIPQWWRQTDYGNETDIEGFNGSYKESVSPTEQKIEDMYELNVSWDDDYLEESFARSESYNFTTNTKLASEYSDSMLLADLGENLTAADWINPNESPFYYAAVYEWDPGWNTYGNWIPREHASARFSDLKYRLYASPSGILNPATKVKFIWKEVFIPQEGEGGEKSVDWFQAESTATNIPFFSGYVTEVRDLIHPKSPGTVYPCINENGINAPDQLAMLNPGETRLLQSTLTSSQGQKITDVSIHRGKPISFQVDLTDQNNNPTLAASGSGTVKLWEQKKDGKWKSHSLPFRIPAEQCAGKSSDPGSYMIQGLVSGTVTLQITAAGAVRYEHELEVRRVDLDVDSDNSGDVDQSNDEENVESDTKEPGKIIFKDNIVESDSNGIPLHPDRLAGLKIQTDKLPSDATITLSYPKEALRIWKSPPGQSPSASDLIDPSRQYSISELGTSLSIQFLGYMKVIISLSYGDITDDVVVGLLPVDLEPDEDMAGVIGDVVKSAKEGSTIKHFVTPKKSAELNQNYVILKATGITAEQITLGHANQIVEWDGGESVPYEPLKRRVKRDATGSAATEVKIKVKQGGVVAVQMYVWVVWVNFESKIEGQSAINNSSLGLVSGRVANGYVAAGGIDYTGTIQPESVIKDQERPALEKQERKAPPGSDSGVAGPGNPDASGSKFSGWDTSRQKTRRVWKGPNLTPTGDGDVEKYRPVNYPVEALEGNDDEGVSKDEDSDPYKAGKGAIGELLVWDGPEQVVVDSQDATGVGNGLDGDRFHYKIWFREFARFQIGNKWYLVSDKQPWRFYFFAKRISGLWQAEPGKQNIFDTTNAELP